MRGKLIIVALTVVSTWLLITGYNAEDLGGLARMGFGGIVASLALRLLFDEHGASGHDANHPSEFADVIPYHGEYTLSSMDPNSPGQ